MHSKPFLLSLLLASSLAVAACGDDTPDPDMKDTTASATGSMEITVVKGEHGPEYPDAQLTVTTPGPDEVVEGDSIMVSVDLTGVDLMAPTAGEQSKGLAYSADGQHIHVIIDDKPYMAMYVPSNFSIGALSEGVHTLRAFPSRSWHESIKTPGAFISHNFYVGSKTGDPILKEGEPLLTYSRPKGKYEGKDAERIMLDFYLSNAELGPDAYKVVLSIDGEVKDTLTEWIPYYIEGLDTGTHAIRLQLVDPDGAPVPGPYNTAEREIEVVR